MDDTVDAFETLAFGVCNTDGIEGLSWDEVEQCEVSINKSIAHLQKSHSNGSNKSHGQF